jgi:hypothetical protein
MGAIGGSVKNISIKGRPFTIAADADGNRDLGGYSNEVQSNGDKTVRVIKTVKPWMLDGLTVSIDDGRDDQSFLQGICDGNDAGDDGLFDCTFTFVDGNTYQGRGTISGDLKKSTKNATCGISLSGSDTLTKQ